ncbi:MAG: hypothetical protein JWP64_5906 [Pseudonocardia sp.]|jgi:hypothetical protein|nr:hypothetical protein [Pseudonocardia sp.]
MPHTVKLKALTRRDAEDAFGNDLVQLRYNGMNVFDAPRSLSAGGSIPINRDFPVEGQAAVNLVDLDGRPLDPGDAPGTRYILERAAGQGDVRIPFGGDDKRRKYTLHYEVESFRPKTGKRVMRFSLTWGASSPPLQPRRQRRGSHRPFGEVFSAVVRIRSLPSRLIKW